MLFTRLSTHFSAVHSVAIVCAEDIRLLFKPLLKFRNVLTHTESRSSFACYQNIKENIPIALEVFLCFERGSEWGDPHVGCRLEFHYFVG